MGFFALETFLVHQRTTFSVLVMLPQTRATALSYSTESDVA
jgi:hypothetical protein